MWLLPVSAELREGGGGCCASGAPMFRTASGKSVSVRQSSIRKAESVLGETGIPDRGFLLVIKLDFFFLHPFDEKNVGYLMRLDNTFLDLRIDSVDFFFQVL